MNTLLQKTHYINKLLQRTGGNQVDFKEMVDVLNTVLSASVMIVGRRGKILSYVFNNVDACPNMQDYLIQQRFPEEINTLFLKISEAQVNTNNFAEICFNENSIFNHVTIVPIIGGGERLGTLILSKKGEDFTDDDLVLAEYSATIVGMEILRTKAERAEDDARKKAAVQIAMGTLSYSELEAANQIFQELEGNEGLLVASKIADRAGLTRSVIVNALRKLESAGVIECKSLGMKGTFIKIINERLIDALKKTQN